MESNDFAGNPSSFSPMWIELENERPVPKDTSMLELEVTDAGVLVDRDFIRHNRWLPKAPADWPEEFQDTFRARKWLGFYRESVERRADPQLSRAFEQFIGHLFPRFHVPLLVGTSPVATSYAYAITDSSLLVTVNDTGSHMHEFVECPQEYANQSVIALPRYLTRLNDLNAVMWSRMVGGLLYMCSLQEPEIDALAILSEPNHDSPETTAINALAVTIGSHVGLFGFMNSNDDASVIPEVQLAILRASAQHSREKLKEMGSIYATGLTMNDYDIGIERLLDLSERVLARPHQPTRGEVFCEEIFGIHPVNYFGNDF